MPLPFITGTSTGSLINFSASIGSFTCAFYGNISVVIIRGFILVFIFIMSFDSFNMVFI